MEWERLTTDELEQRLIANRRLRSGLDAIDMEILEVLDTRQVATADGSRSLSEWLAARVDVSLDTARRLVRAMRRTCDRPDLREALGDGEASFDRVEALSKMSEDVGLLAHLDIGGVARLVANRVRISADDERRTAADRFLVMQPNLDESWWKLWGALDGPSGELVDKVLTEAADALPELPDGTRGDSSWRRATALVQTMISDDPPPAQVTVIVDTEQASRSNGQAGVTLEPGSRVGREALEAILCDSVVEVTARDGHSRYMEYGRKMRTAPPALKRALLHRAGHVCEADGCASRNRLQVHHLTPWSRGGATNQDQLVLLCWYHHHVVIHQQGFDLYRHQRHGRIRFRRPPPRAPDPPI